MTDDKTTAWQMMNLQETQNAIENKIFMEHKAKNRKAMETGTDKIIKMVSQLTKYNDFPDHALDDFRKYKQHTERIHRHFETYLLNDAREKREVLKAVKDMCSGVSFQVIHSEEHKANEHLEMSTFDEMRKITFTVQRLFFALMDLRSCDEQPKLKFQAGFDKLLKANKL